MKKYIHFFPVSFFILFITSLILIFNTDLNFRVLFTLALTTAAGFVTTICVVSLHAGFTKAIHQFICAAVLMIGVVLLFKPQIISFALVAMPVLVVFSVEFCLWEVAVASKLYRGRMAGLPLLLLIAFMISVAVFLLFGTSLVFATAALLSTVVLALLGVLFGYRKEFDFSQPAEFPDQSTYEPKA